MSASQDSARAGAGASPVSSAGSARERVLGRVKAALGREHSEASADNLPDDVVQRLASHRRHTLPALGEDLVQRAIEQMESVLISVVRLQSSDDVVEAVRFWRESEGIEGGLSVSPALSNLNWPDCQRIMRWSCMKIRSSRMWTMYSRCCASSRPCRGR